MAAFHVCPFPAPSKRQGPLGCREAAARVDVHAFASDGGHHRPLTIQGGLQAEPRSVYVFCEQPMQQPLHLYHMFVMLSQQQE